MIVRCGTKLVRGNVARQAVLRMHRRLRHGTEFMKSITTKDIVSLAGIALAVPLFTLATVLSARAAGVAGNDLLLLALALGGAVISGLNGFGHRRAQRRVRVERQTRLARKPVLSS
jgi:positive regulator of sigma E activity